MRTRKTRRVTARYQWDRLKVSFWFAPAVMSLGAILLAVFMYWFDGRIPTETLQERYLILSGTPSELRTLLIGMASTILAAALGYGLAQLLPGANGAFVDAFAGGALLVDSMLPDSFEHGGKETGLSLVIGFSVAVALVLLQSQ